MILVTGGTGLIGSHLLVKLATKYESVRAVKRPSGDLNNVRKIFAYSGPDTEQLFNRIEWIEADITDIISVRDALKGIKYVYHAAGLVSFDRRRKRELFLTNAEGTANMVNASMESGIQKFCYVSSIATLGEDGSTNPITEMTRWKPAKTGSVYSYSKFKAEMEVWRGIAEGLNAVIVNPAIVIGPGFWHGGVGTVISLVEKGMDYYTEGVTSYIDVRDVANIMVQLMESEISEEQFILASESLSFRDVLDTIAGILGKPKATRCASGKITGLAWRLDFLRSLFTRSRQALTRDSAIIAHRKYHYSSQKIQNTLDYRFIPVPDSFRYMIEKYLTEKNSGQ